MSRSIVACESLEVRRLYAGIHLVKRVLEIGGWPIAPNTITIALTPDEQSITATLSFTAKRNKPVTVVTKTVPVADVSLLYIVGGKASDFIQISDPPGGTFPIPARILTGNGNDTVYGGGEPDSIVGGIGEDLLSGGGGDDSIYGEIGNDTLVGGAGSDTLHGGRGFDYIDGSAGTNDVIIGGHGGDTLLGGDSGDSVNTFYVMSIQSDSTNYRPYIDHLHDVTIAPKSDSTSWWDQVTNYLPFL